MFDEMIGKNKKIQDLITEIANKTLGITPEQIAKAREMYRDDPRSLDEIRAELEKLSAKITDETIKRKEMYEKMFGANESKTDKKEFVSTSDTVQDNNTQSPDQAESNQNEQPDGNEPAAPEDLQETVNESSDTSDKPQSDLTDDEYYKTEFLDLDLGDFDLSEGVNYPEPVLEELRQNMSTDGDLTASAQTSELDSMFAPAEQTPAQAAQTKTDEKGKTMVKTANEGSTINNNGGYSSALNLSFMLSTVSILGLFLASVLILISRSIG